MSRPGADSPLWKDEFSVHTADERYVSRRQFTKFLTLTSLAMFAGQIWIAVKAWFSRERPAAPLIVIGKTSEILTGGVKLFAYPTPQDHCILVCNAAGQYAAYSQKCTHLSCAVYYEQDKNRFACPCHNGYFSVEDGRVLAGPPTRSLPRVTVTLRGADIVATGVEGA